MARHVGINVCWCFCLSVALLHHVASPIINLISCIVHVFRRLLVASVSGGSCLQALAVLEPRIQRHGRPKIKDNIQRNRYWRKMMDKWWTNDGTWWRNDGGCNEGVGNIVSIVVEFGKCLGTKQSSKSSNMLRGDLSHGHVQCCHCWLVRSFLRLSEETLLPQYLII